MKKIFTLLLCLALLCTMLVGCGKDVIGEYLENYDTGNSNKGELVKLHFYMIVGEGTSEEAKTTVPQNINTYLKEAYNIELIIHYVSENEYHDVVLAAARNTNEDDRADIILINSLKLFSQLYQENLLVDLTDFYNDRKYKTINTLIEDNLLAASLVSEPVKGSDAYTTHYYTVPNNHKVGTYQYIVINKELARDILHFNNSEIAAMTSNESLAELVEEIEKYYVETYPKAEHVTDEEYAAAISAFVNDNVYVVEGNYEDKLLLEYDVDSASEIRADDSTSNFVNVSSYPVASAEEAFSSAFAIVKRTTDVADLSEEEREVLKQYYQKSMNIILALNNDKTLRNMLQYGYVGTNYKFIKNLENNTNTNYITLNSGDVAYNMNLYYTGNPYIAYYCNSIGWNEEVYANTIRQNAESVRYQ